MIGRICISDDNPPSFIMPQIPFVLLKSPCNYHAWITILRVKYHWNAIYIYMCVQSPYVKHIIFPYKPYAKHHFPMTSGASRRDAIRLKSSGTLSRSEEAANLKTWGISPAKNSGEMEIPWHHSMDWFSRENLNRKPEWFSHKIIMGFSG